MDHLAKTAIFTNINEKVIHGINLIRLRPDISRINPFFASRVFKSTQFIYKARSFAQKAVNQASIKTTDLKSIQIPLPPLEVQREIVEEIEGYQKIIDGASQVVDNWKPQIEIAPEWPMVKLGDVFKLTSGKFLPQKDQVPGNYLVYGGNGISGKHNEYFLEKPTLIIGRVGEYCGAVHITEPKSWVTDNALMINEYLINIEQDYLSTALTLLEINNYAKRGGQPSISQTTVYDLSLPLPPLEIQQEIVTKIEAERKVVDGCRELIKIYKEKIKRVIDKVWEE